MGSIPGWKSVEKTWMLKLANQAVPRTGTPPDTCLLLTGNEPRGSYIESLVVKPYGLMGNVIVHLWAKPSGSTNYFLLNSGAVGALASISLGSDVYSTDLTDLLPQTLFPAALKDNSGLNRILKIGPGVEIYIGLDQALSPGGITVWAQGGDLIEDGEAVPYPPGLYPENPISNAVIESESALLSLLPRLSEVAIDNGNPFLSEVIDFIGTPLEVSSDITLDQPSLLLNFSGTSNPVSQNASLDAISARLKLQSGKPEIFTVAAQIPSESSRTIWRPGILEVSSSAVLSDASARMILAPARGEVTVPSGYEAETNSLIARYTGSYSTTDLDTRNTFIKNLKNNGLWSTIDIFYLFAAPIESDAILNWKSTSYNCVEVGTVTFTANQGYTGMVNSNYLRTQFNPSTAGGNYSLNSASIGIWCRSNVQASQNDLGASSTGTSVGFYTRNTNNNIGATINSSTSFFAPSGTILTSQGFTLVTRTGSTSSAIYKDGSSVATSTNASTSLPNNEIYITAFNSSGSTVAGSAKQYSAFVVASGWNSTQQATFRSELNTLLTYIGAT